MKKFIVTFYCSDEGSYNKTFESKDIDSLLAHINSQKFIVFPGRIHDIKSKKWKSYSVVYMNSVQSLDIEEIIYEDKVNQHTH